MEQSSQCYSMATSSRVEPLDDGVQLAERALCQFFNLPLTVSPSSLLEQNEYRGIASASKEKKIRRGSSRDEFLEKSLSFQSNQDQTATAAPQPLQTPPRHQRYEYRIPPPPPMWPQRPLLIRATPGSSTQIVGIRSVARHEDFWQEYAAVPINNGYEGYYGESMVTDFVSKHFVGSMLVRIKGISSFLQENKARHNTNTTNYFDNRQRTFQCVIRGRFLHPLPMQDCVTGQVFRRPAGILPAHWIVQTFEKVVQRLAPHNELHLEGPYPRSLAPSITTAQTIRVDEYSQDNMSSRKYLSNQPRTDDQGLVMCDGNFFYDSIYDKFNECHFASNTIPTMEQDWQEPHASDPQSLVHEIIMTTKHPSKLDQLHPPASRENNSQRNRKYRKSFLNKFLRLLEHEQQQQEKKSTEQHPNNLSDRDDKYSNNTAGSHKTNNNHLQFDPQKMYTFEFYEHWVCFDDPHGLALDLRIPFLRHIAVAPCTDGQPIQVMSAVRRNKKDDEPCSSDEKEANNHDNDLEYLWNFEVWHESLYPYAERASSSKQDPVR